MSTAVVQQLIAASPSDAHSLALRAGRADRPNSRGVHLIQAIADAWGVGVGRHHTEIGKPVWAELRMAA